MEAKYLIFFQIRPAVFTYKSLKFLIRIKPKQSIDDETLHRIPGTERIKSRGVQLFNMLKTERCEIKGVLISRASWELFYMDHSMEAEMKPLLIVDQSKAPEVNSVKEQSLYLFYKHEDGSVWLEEMISSSKEYRHSAKYVNDFKRFFKCSESHILRAYDQSSERILPPASLKSWWSESSRALVDSQRDWELQ